MAAAGGEQQCVTGVDLRLADGARTISHPMLLDLILDLHRSGSHLRQHWTCCVTLWDILGLSGCQGLSQRHAMQPWHCPPTQFPSWPAAGLSWLSL